MDWIMEALKMGALLTWKGEVGEMGSGKHARWGAILEWIGVTFFYLCLPKNVGLLWGWLSQISKK
jgi:hypothetical protein